MTIKKNHELTAIFNAHVGSEIDRVRQYVLSNNQCGTPIIVYTFQGKIIDGRMTYQICLELGIEPIFKEITENPVDFIVKRNLPYRVITSRKLLEIAVRLWQLAKNDSAILPKAAYKDLRQYIADIFKIGSRNLSKAMIIFNNACPELIDDFLNKKVSTDKAWKIVIAKDQDEQRMLLNTLEHAYNRINYFDSGFQVKQDCKNTDICNADNFNKEYPAFSDSVKLFKGNFRDVSKHIPDNSIDIIISDPPYQKECYDLIPEFGKLAQRVLKENGIMVLMVSTLSRFEYEKILKNFLTLHHMIVYFMPSNGFTALRGHKCNTFKIRYKPILVFSKGNLKDIGAMNDVLNYEYMCELLNSNNEDSCIVMNAGKKENRKTETGHPHAQDLNGFESIVNSFTKPGISHVLDMTMGTGTTGAAAIKNNCFFTGIEINEQHFDWAYNNLKKVFDEHKANNIVEFRSNNDTATAA